MSARGIHYAELEEGSHVCYSFETSQCFTNETIRDYIIKYYGHSECASQCLRKW